MNLNDNHAPRGDLAITVRKNGRAVDGWVEQNLVVNNARVMLAKLIAGDSGGSAITHFGIGTSGTTPTPDNTSLTGSHWRPVDGFEFPQPGQVRFTFHIGTQDFNGMTIREFGLRTANGELFSRKARGAIEKNDDISIEGAWTITF